MASPTGFSVRATYQPHPPRFAGGNGARQPAAAKPAPPTTGKTSPKKLGLLDTFKELFKELKNPETRNVFKGLSFKYLPEAGMSALCAIPGVGWLVNIIAIPFHMFLTNKGEKILKEAGQKLDKRGNRTHYGLHHSLKMDNAWNGDAKKQFFGKPLKNKKHSLAEYMVHKYNKTIQGIFHRSEALQQKLQINIKEKSRIFRSFRRWTEARQSLRQTRFLGWIFNKMSGLKAGGVDRAIPKPLKLLLLLPRLSLQFIFFAIGKKPRFKP